MATYVKCTSFFQQGVAGWSETWYLNTTSLAAAFAKHKAVLNLRQALLATEAKIIGQRESHVGTPHQSQVTDLAASGGSALDNDIVQMALEARVYTADAKQRSVLLRGVPDARVVNGLYSGSSAYNNALSQYFAGLIQGEFCIQTIDRAQRLKLTGVTADGLITTNENVALFSDQGRFRFYRSKDILGVTLRGVYKTILRVGSSNFTQINQWPGGRVVGASQIQLLNFTPTPITVAQTSVIRVTTRKTGRPFGVPRGRVSVKK